MNSGHGFYNSKKDECTCFENYYGIKCESRTCVSGLSWNGGSYSVCSDRGDCDSESGLCKCYSSYSGDSCSIKGCENSCSSHGICVSDEEYYKNHVKKVKYETSSTKYVVDNSDIVITELMKQRKQCICESGYTGTDCSIKECPYGAIGTKAIKDGYYEKTGQDSKAVPKNEITNGGSTFTADFTIYIANCPKIPPNDGSEILCRYESVKLKTGMTKDDIRNEILKSGIVHDIVVELKDASDNDIDKLSTSTTLTLYYILDPFAFASLSSSSFTHTYSTYLPVFRQCCGKNTCQSGKCVANARATDPSGIDPYIKEYGLNIENGQTKDNDGCPAGSTVSSDKCVCDTASGYGGADCHAKCPDVNGVECNNHGKCNNNGVCECDEGYGGSSKDCLKDIIPISAGDEGEECNGNGKLNADKTACECKEGYEGNTCNERKCPKGPLQVDLRCETVSGDPPKITFTFKENTVYKATMNGKYSRQFIYDSSVEDIDKSPVSQIKTIGGFISFLKKYIGIRDDIKIETGNNGHNENTPILTSANPFTLSFYYYCDDELCPTRKSSIDGLRIYKDTDLLEITIEGIDYNSPTGDNGKMEFFVGTIKCDICGKKGVCNKETGLCECFKQYKGSKGWNKDKTEIEIGDRGDCSYFTEAVYPMN